MSDQFGASDRPLPWPRYAASRTPLIGSRRRSRIPVRAFLTPGPVMPNSDCSFTKGIRPVADSIQKFIFDSLQEMNYDVEGINENTELGPRGADLASLGLAELAIRVEDEFGVKFDEDEAEELADMTVGEFCTAVAERIGAAKTAAE
jgi:acyl carrier protein